MHILGFGSQQDEDHIKKLIEETNKNQRECKVIFEGKKMEKNLHLLFRNVT